MALCAEDSQGRGTTTVRSKAFAEASKAFANRKELSVMSTAKALRRSLFAVFAASAAGGAIVAALMGNAAPSATAATDPCAASELARTIGSMAPAMGKHLHRDPQNKQAP